jgi:glycosyltransferase involved in cell wall biosynthesis
VDRHSEEETLGADPVARTVSVGVVMARTSRAAGGVFDAVRGALHALHPREDVRAEVYSVWDEQTEADTHDWRPYVPRVSAPIGPASFAGARGLGGALAAGHHDLVHQHGLWLYPSIAVSRWRRQSRRPVVISPHGMLDAWALRNSEWKKQIAAAVFERANLRAAACLHALSKSEADAIRSYGLVNPIAIIPNGVTLPNEGGATVAAPPWNDDGRRTLLFLGRIHPKKGVFETLRAWAALKELAPGVAAGWRLVLAGWVDGGHAGAIRRLASDLGLADGEEVLFPGPLFGLQKGAALARANAFILASHSEGLPIAVLEAWANRVPVFMTSHCNLPEGFSAHAAIPVDTDPGLLARQLADGLAREDLAEIGERGRRLVESQFTWQHIADCFATLYRWATVPSNAPPEFVVTP